MEVGTALLYLALGLGLGSLVLSFAHLYTWDGRLRRLARYLAIAFFLMISLALLLLAYYFLASDMHIEYVHSYTDANYAWYYKLAGVWAGEKGTLLLWTWIMSLTLVIQEYLLHRKGLVEGRKKAKEAEEPRGASEDEDSETERDADAGEGGKTRKASRSKGGEEPGIHDWTRIIVTIAILAFTAFLVSFGMFDTTDPIALTFYPEGRGLNPLLLTPYLVVHPVLEFAAYGLTAIPMAAVLAYLITNDKKWTDITLTWSRFAWLFYTLAIGVGALWAYNVLGWGGYWAWDPVETGNLIPWIALTGFLHAQSYYRKNRGYTFIAPLLAVSVFILTIFATFETRSGLVVSVLHSFTGAGSQVLDPSAKLLTILGANPSANFFMVLMLVTVIAAGALFIWRFSEIRRREGLSGASLYLPYIYIAFLAGLAIFAILNVASFTSYGISAAKTAGLGNLGIGLIVVSLILIGIPLLWILFTSKESEDDEGIDADKEGQAAGERDEPGDEAKTTKKKWGISDYINAKNLMLVTVVIFFIWFVITLLLMLMGVNGLEAAVFEDRLPLLLVPLLIVMAVCLTWKFLGRKAGLYMVVGLVVVTIIAYGLLYGNVVSIYAAALAAALFATCYRIVRVGLPKKRGVDLPAIGGILLVIAGVLGMVTWSNPPAIVLFSISLELPLAYAPVGFMFGLGALIGGLTTLGLKNRGLSIVLALLGILSFGYFFIGTILSAVALVIVLASGRSFSKSGRLKSLKPALKTTGTYLIHLGAVLLIIGYVASNYFSDEKDFNPSTIGSLATFSPVEFKDYTISIKDSGGEDTNGDGLLETIDVDVAVTKGNAQVGTATMQFYWMIPANPAESPHYMIRIDTLITSTEDLYFIGYAFSTPDDGWIQAMGDTGIQFSSSDVQEVAFQVTSIPMMGALWGGLYIMSVGILLLATMGYGLTRRKDIPRKAAGARQMEPAAPRADEDDAGKEEKPPESEKAAAEDEKQRLKKEEDYERMFEEELADMEDGE